MEAQVEATIITVEEESCLFNWSRLAAVATSGSGSVVRGDTDVLSKRAIALSAKVHREVVPRNTLVTLATWCDTEFEVVDALFQVLHAVVRFVLIVGSVAVNKAEVKVTDITFHLELRALEIVVVFLVLRHNSKPTSVRTLDELLRALINVP
jgi:hypothetical protein